MLSPVQFLADALNPVQTFNKVVWHAHNLRAYPAEI